MGAFKMTVPSVFNVNLKRTDKIPNKTLKTKIAFINNPFRETLEVLGQGKYVQISLQRWVVVYKEDIGDITILCSDEGIDFEDENFNHYPTLPNNTNDINWHECKGGKWVINGINNDEVKLEKKLY